MYTSDELRYYRTRQSRLSVILQLLAGGAVGLMLTGLLIMAHGGGFISYNLLVFGGVLFPVLTLLLSAFHGTAFWRFVLSFSDVSDFDAVPPEDEDSAL